MPGRVMSRIRQLGPPQPPLFKTCSAVSKLSDRRLADFSRPWIDARIRGSSSTTNTMDDSVAMYNLIVNGSGLREWRDQLIPRATPFCLPSHRTRWAHLSECAIRTSQFCRFVPRRHHYCTRSAKVRTQVESHSMRLLLRSSPSVLQIVRPTDTRASRS